MIAQHTFHAQKEGQRADRLPTWLDLSGMVYAISFLECRIVDQPACACRLTRFHNVNQEDMTKRARTRVFDVFKLFVPSICVAHLCLAGLQREARACAKPGGASRDRTGDLKLAKLALSQLSYGPEFNHARTGLPAEAARSRPLSSCALRASEDNLRRCAA